MRTQVKAVVALVVALVVGMAAAGCSQPSPTAPTPTPTAALTPARNIEGPWVTAAPVEFTYQTDFCGSRRDVARALWNVTWNITAVSGFTNVVEIEMRTSKGSSAPVGNCQFHHWVDLPSPIFFKACVSGDQLSRCSNESYPNGSASGPFTADLMQVTWSHWECGGYCFGEYTATNALKLVRRR